MRGMRSRSVRLVLVLSSLLAGGAFLVLAPRIPLDVAPAYAARSYAARGVIQSIAADRSSVTIAHEAIPGFMPAMTMAFEARSPKQLDGFRDGDRVTFSFTVTDDGRRLIDSIRLVTKSR
jgi:Cu(I)/Ag(I) efflux system protein CusF